jgi:hypothetical protein
MKYIVRTLTVLFLFSISFNLSYSQEKAIYNFAKTYATVRYFYPNPDLKELDWNKYLIINSEKILNESFNLEDEIKKIAPKSDFLSDSLKDIGIINKNELKSYFYWQHFGGLVTQEKGYPDKLLASQIIGDIDKAKTMLRNQLFSSDALHKRIEFKCHAKFPTTKKDSALVMLHTGYKDKKGEIINNFYPLWIYPCFDWKEYKLDTVFCENFPHKGFFTFIKLIRPTYDSVLIDDITIRDAENNDLLYRFSTESYDTLYNRFRLIYFYHSGNMAMKSSDSYEGRISLKLLGSNELTYYPQTELKEFIQLKLSDDKWLILPRFIEKTDTANLSASIDFFNKTDTDSIDVKAIYLADIIHLWTALENSYPYPDIRKSINSDELFYKCINRILSDTDYNETSHYRNLVYLLSAYDDPHMSVKTKARDRFKSPVWVEFVNNEFRVKQVYNDKYSYLIGETVKSINGTDIENLIESFIYKKESKLYNPHLLNKYLGYYLTGYNDTEYTFEFINEKSIKITLDDLVTEKMKPVSSYIKEIPDTSYVFSNGQAFYIHNRKFGKNRLGLKEAEKFVIDSISKFKYIVVDLRQSGYNYVCHELFHAKMRTENIFAMPDYMSTVQKPFSKEPAGINLNLLNATRHIEDTVKINAKIFVLVDEDTKSIVERLLLPLYETGNITLIGKQTAGTAGNVNKVYLPSGFQISFTTSFTKYNNGEEYQNKGMIPNYIIDDTYNIFSKDDAFLNKAMDLIVKE